MGWLDCNHIMRETINQEEGYRELQCGLCGWLISLSTKRKMYTCHDCRDNKVCSYAYNLYNTSGDCLAEK